MSAVAFNRARYGQLLANALPHVIQTDEENKRCIAKLETLLNRGNLSSEEKELADLLTVLIESYEERYSDVLSGKRELSKTPIRALSKRFNVSPEVFFD
jgi:antitoxin component HigA of HigAB toxin-antitoxin module